MFALVPQGFSKKQVINSMRMKFKLIHPNV